MSMVELPTFSDGTSIFQAFLAYEFGIGRVVKRKLKYGKTKNVRKLEYFLELLKGCSCDWMALQNETEFFESRNGSQMSRILAVYD